MPAAARPHLLSQGPDLEAAQALATGCGTTEPVTFYDPAQLDLALATGQRCVLVWSDPQATLADALRSGLSPGAAASAWLDFAREVLQKAAAANLIMVDAALIRSGDHGALTLALSLPHTLPALAALPGDRADLLATLLLPHVPDLMAQWQHLRRASLAPDPSLAPDQNLFPQGDLDTLAGRARVLATPDQVLAAPHPPATVAAPTSDDPPHSGTGPDPTAGEETRLLRDHLAYLLTDPGLGGTAAPPDPASDFAPAVARLLAELVQETDRRIRAEHQVRRAHAALRRLGIDGTAIDCPVN